MSNNNGKDIDENKIEHENVFSTPNVQYQTINTEEWNKEIKGISLVDITGKSVFSTNRFHNKNGLIIVKLNKDYDWIKCN